MGGMGGMGGGMGWDGMGWDGMGWDEVGWRRTGRWTGLGERDTAGSEIILSNPIQPYLI